VVGQQTTIFHPTSGEVTESEFKPVSEAMTASEVNRGMHEI
jgi:hypothetical protein